MAQRPVDSILYREASMTALALVVPTRNEAANIEPFVERVAAALAPFPIEWHAEMVDDSDDDTAARLRTLASRGAPVRVIRQDGGAIDGGLGSAIRTGLKRATGDVVCVIDADLQHPPEILPALVAPIVLGRADICVGSRYRRGGSAAGLESHWRRLAARAAAVAVRWLLPATRLTSDPGSGLFAVRRDVLESVDLRATGPRVLAEILAQARWYAICDVPYRFALTDGGNADLGVADGVAAARELIGLWQLRPWIAALRNGRNGRRRIDPDLVRRRVAPVHVELLRPAGRDGAPSQADRGW
jgi:dolichol-phosphate mannosyltransferase